LVENLDVIGSKRVRIENEPVVLTQKRDTPAVRGATIGLVFRTLVEAAETAEICARPVDKKHIDLMVSDAHLLVVPERVNRTATQDTQTIEVLGIIDPDGHVDVLGFVKGGSAAAHAARFESRSGCDRAKQGHSTNGTLAREGGGNVLGRFAEMRVAGEDESVDVEKARVVFVVPDGTIHGCLQQREIVPIGRPKSTRRTRTI
jgi:hypothetical protein